MSDAYFGIAFKAAASVFRRPWVMRWMWRKWYSRSPDRALRKFRSLAGSVEGLREQVNEENVNPEARARFAAELDELSVYPQAIRGERGEAHLEPELYYLFRCMTATEDYLSLPLARTAFSTGPQRELDYDRDALAAAYDRHLG